MSTIDVLFIKDGSQNWIAQGLQYDIAAQGSTIKKAKRAFELAIVSEIAIAMEKEEGVFESINPAPQKYWEMWMNVGEPVSVSRSPYRVPAGYNVPQFGEARVA